MVFNSVLGVGRELQYSGVKRSTVVSDSGSGWSPLSISGSTAITQLPQKIFALMVTISPRDTSGLPGSAINPTLTIFLDNETLVTYKLPGESANSSGWVISETIPIDRELWGSGHELRFLGTCTSVSPDYSILLVATLQGVLI